MIYIKEILLNNDINLLNITIRLLLSFILGGLIGINRERHNQPAGLKTHILICVGSTLLMLLSIYMPHVICNSTNVDPGRIAAQVVTGIGFLGAGAILKLGIDVKGLTSAATIWVVAALGLVIGAGMYQGAFIGTAIILFALVGVDFLEKKVFPSKDLRVLQIFLKTDKIKTDNIFPIIEKHGIGIINIDISQSLDEKSVKMRLLVRIPKELNYKSFYKDVGNIKGVNKVSLEYNFS